MTAPLRAAGFVDAYAAEPQPTCNPNGQPSRIDFILVSPGFDVAPEPLCAIDSGTALPSTSEPSDHLPITARMRWIDQVARVTGHALQVAAVPR